MIARIRKGLEDKDQGFTLIELLVVMIIIGILAAVAIPIFLSQREKAQDTAAKADVSTLGKEIATYYVDGTGVPTVVKNTSGYFVDGNFVGTASQNVELALASGITGTGSTNWCVAVTNAEGDVAASSGFQYSAQGGLEPGSC